jgi:hypothetical protein
LSLDLCEHLGGTRSGPGAGGYKDEAADCSGVSELQEPMVPFMPGERTADKERAFFAIFSIMIGAVEIARLRPDRAMREKVLASTREFLLRSF